MKNRVELFSIFQKFHAKIRTQFNTSIRILRSDNAKEYLFGPFFSFMSSHEILHQFSYAHTPQRNGVAECKNRYLVETARTLLLHHKVPQCFWRDDILAACYLINCTSSSVLHDKITHSILFPNQPHFCLPPRVFGCVCFVHILTPRQYKLSAKATKRVFLNYSRLQQGYRCYSPNTHRYFVSVDVTFFENSSMFPTTHPLNSDVISLPLLYLILDSSSVPSATPPRPLQVYTRCPRTKFGPPIDSSPMAPSSTTLISPSPVDLPIAVRKGTRSSRNPHPIYNFLTYHRLSSPCSAFISTLSSVTLPKTVHEAFSHPGWKQAMIENMVALHSTGTWDLVTLPTGKTHVGCRWVYTIKIDPDGGVDRLKACSVVKGYTQIYGSDYYDTFSPVAKMASICLLFSMATMRSWPQYQLDIKKAFLHGDLAEEVYMEQPPKLVVQGEFGLVCRLHRSLYGLKQSPRAWFGHFSSMYKSSV